MQDPRDQDASVVAVVDDVAFDDGRAHACAELGSRTSHRRLVHEQIEPDDDGVDEPVGRRRTGILGDVEPDLLEVLLGEERADRASTASVRERRGLST